jgi:hypothetical protein
LAVLIKCLYYIFMNKDSKVGIEQHIKNSLIIENTTDKISKFIMLLKSIDSKNICFNEQKLCFERYGKVKITKNLKNYIISCLKML